MKNPFSELGLSDELVSTIVGMGYEQPSEIQARAIPLILDGGDVVGLSQTGSGKTAAFSLPLLEMLDHSVKAPQILVVCPTRELSQQVAKAIQDFAVKLKGVRVANLYGGAPYPEQIHQLKQNPAIIVGTPGRLQDHLRKGTFKTTEISAVVLDEADRMLDMGFRDEIRELLEDMPEDRQNVFFSATINKEISRLIERFSKDVETIQISGKVKPASSIKQAFIEVRETSKLEILRRLVLRDAPGQAVIFCNTKRKVEEAADALNTLGLSVERLHGDMSQPMRERVIKRFHQGHVRLLIATDVAGRGLDVAGIEAVYVLEMSHEPEDYVHRIGRTGRAGRSGAAYSLVSKKDFRYMKNVERYIGEKIPEEQIPSHEDLLATHEKVLVKKLVQKMELVVADEGAEPEFDEEGKLIESAQMKVPEFESFEQFLDIASEDEVDVMEVIKGLIDSWKDDSRPALNSIPEDRPGDRTPREKSENFVEDENFDTLYVGFGREDDASAGQLTGIFYNECNLSEGAVGKIRLFGRHALVGIAKDQVQKVLDAKIVLNNRQIPIRPDRGFGGGKDGDKRSRGGDRRGGGGGRRDRGDRGDRGGYRGERKDRGERGDRGGDDRRGNFKKRRRS